MEGSKQRAPTGKGAQDRVCEGGRQQEQDLRPGGEQLEEATGILKAPELRKLFVTESARGGVRLVCTVFFRV